MGGFFHGWRRKVGCITLLVACLLAGMWIRSNAAYDGIWLTIEGRRYMATSVGGRVGFWSQQSSVSHGWISQRLEADHAAGLSTMLLGQAVVLPYWSLILPLTLFSAYLILWKPK